MRGAKIPCFVMCPLRIDSFVLCNIGNFLFLFENEIASSSLCFKVSLSIILLLILVVIMCRCFKCLSEIEVRVGA